MKNPTENYKYEYKEILQSSENDGKKEGRKISYWHEYVIATPACFGMLLSGLHFAWIGPALPLLLDRTAKISITTEQTPLVAGCLQIGAIPGSILGSLLADWLGRKRALIIITIPYFLASMMLVFLNDVSQIYIARFLSGFGVGASFSLVPMYLGEIASAQIRGILGIYKIMLLNIGILMQFTIAPFVAIETNALICATIPVIMCISLMFAPESPYYYLMKGRDKEAEKSLEKLRRTKDVAEEMQRLKDGRKEDENGSRGMSDLFLKKSNRKALIVIFGLITIQQFGGATAVFTYSQVIFEKANISISPEMCGIFLAFANFLITFVCGVLIDSLGRRPLCLISCIFSAIMIFTLGVYFYLQEIQYPHLALLNLIPPVAVVGFKFAYGIGIGPVPYICLAELFPTSVKASALGVISVYGSVCGFTVTKLYQLVTDSFGESTSFFCFFVICLSGALFVYFVQPETKGRTLEQIQIDLKA